MTCSPTQRRTWERKYIIFYIVFFLNAHRCKKRHDEFFKDMFLQDGERDYYQQKYEGMLIELLEGMITLVDQKIKRSIQRIEMPLPDSAMMPEISQFQQETTH